jgi:hypothetical protein
LRTVPPRPGLRSMQLDYRFGRGGSRTSETYCSLPGDQPAIGCVLEILAGNAVAAAICRSLAGERLGVRGLADPARRPACLCALGRAIPGLWVRPRVSLRVYGPSSSTSRLVSLANPLAQPLLDRRRICVPRPGRPPRCELVAGKSIKAIPAGQSVNVGQSQMPEGDTVAAVCCCRRGPLVRPYLATMGVFRAPLQYSVSGSCVLGVDSCPFPAPASRAVNTGRGNRI